jgi:heat shock protein HslJ
MKKLTTYTLLLCATCASLLSCRSKTEASFSGMKWIVERVKAQGIKAKEDMYGVYITFDDSTKVVRGKAGCNTFFATYHKTGSHGLTFSGLNATKTTCPEMYVEAIFFKILDETNSYSLRHDRLYLRKDSETLAVFRPGNRRCPAAPRR